MVMVPGLSVAESAGRDPMYPAYPATRVAHLVASIPAGIQVEMIIIYHRQDHHHCIMEPHMRDHPFVKATSCETFPSFPYNI